MIRPIQRRAEGKLPGRIVAGAGEGKNPPPFVAGNQVAPRLRIAVANPVDQQLFRFGVLGHQAYIVRL